MNTYEITLLVTISGRDLEGTVDALLYNHAIDGISKVISVKKISGDNHTNSN